MERIFFPCANIGMETPLHDDGVVEREQAGEQHIIQQVSVGVEITLNVFPVLQFQLRFRYFPFSG